MQNSTAKCQPLLLSTGHAACEHAAFFGKLHEGENRRYAVLFALAGQTVEAGIEIHVFQGGEVMIEAEFLRHIANMLLDLRGICSHIIAQDMCLSRSGTQQTA